VSSGDRWPATSRRAILVKRLFLIHLFWDNICRGTGDHGRVRGCGLRGPY
jgi:hypothetical protein